MNAGKIQLTMTDEPRPPQPPANDDLETQRETEERGLRGIGRRMSGALQGALENPAEREKLRQMKRSNKATMQDAENQQDKLRQLQLNASRNKRRTGRIKTSFAQTG